MDISFLQIPSPVTACSSDFLNQYGIELDVKRDDLIHPELQGNKWRKLKYNLFAAKQQNKKTLLTFGGAYSNHIHATAAAGKLFGFSTIGIIRGEEYQPLNPTLQDAKNDGMQLHYINRIEYKNKTQASFIQNLKRKHGDFYLIPEGGCNNLALQGVAEIHNEIEEYNFIFQACGTGTTLAGLISAANINTKLMGVAVLKSADFLNNDIQKLLQKEDIDKSVQWEIILDYHFGGYAKTKPELLEFIDSFKRDYKIQLEPIYTGKMMFALFDMIRKNKFKKGSRILAIHSGGLQGFR